MVIVRLATSSGWRHGMQMQDLWRKQFSIPLQIEESKGPTAGNAGTLTQHFPVLLSIALPSDNSSGSVSSQHLSTKVFCTTQNEREKAVVVRGPQGIFALQRRSIAIFA
jgi:hypothetical protein